MVFFQHCIGILHLNLFNTLALGDLFRSTDVGVFKLAWFVGRYCLSSDTQVAMLPGTQFSVCDRAVDSHTRGPDFESSHQPILMLIYSLLIACRKDEKKGCVWHIHLKISTSKGWYTLRCESAATCDRWVAILQGDGEFSISALLQSIVKSQTTHWPVSSLKKPLAILV